MAEKNRIGVLIVDDDPDHAFLARAALENDPRWDVDTAPTLAAARARLAERTYEVVVADFRLPDGDGLELVDAIRAHGLAIIMTAQGSERVAVDALQRGAYDYVVKDLDFQIRLPSVVDRALGRFRAQIEGAERHRHIQLENRQLAQVNRRLKELDAAKSEFLATASHELRTPLAIIREFVALMRDELVGPITPDQRECLDSALNNCDRLETLVSDILDLQRIESGRVRLRRRRLDLLHLLKECYHDFLPRFAAREQVLELVVPAELPDVLGDEARITQVLLNLVGNAGKHTPPGARVQIRAHARAERVIVSVEDTGPGIPAEDQERIFEKFVQLNRQHGAGARGTGLGLAIAKNIIALHEGDIWLSSAPGEGSRFYFALPVYEVALGLRALIKDRLVISEMTGEPTTLTLLRVDADAERDPGERDLILARAREVAEAQLRRRDDEVFVSEEESLLAILTANGEAGEADKGRAGGEDGPAGESVAARLLAALTAHPGASTGLSWSSVVLGSGREPGEWIAIARERLAPAARREATPAA